MAALGGGENGGGDCDVTAWEPATTPESRRGRSHAVPIHSFMALLIHSWLYSFIRSFVRSLPSSITPRPSAALPGPGASRSGCLGFIPVPLPAARVIPAYPGASSSGYPELSRSWCLAVLAYPGASSCGYPGLSPFCCLQMRSSHLIPVLQTRLSRSRSRYSRLIPLFPGRSVPRSPVSHRHAAPRAR